MQTGILPGRQIPLLPMKNYVHDFIPVPSICFTRSPQPTRKYWEILLIMQEVKAIAFHCRNKSRIKKAMTPAVFQSGTWLFSYSQNLYCNRKCFLFIFCFFSCFCRFFNSFFHCCFRFFHCFRCFFCRFCGFFHNCFRFNHFRFTCQ